ncbi:heparanase-like protein 1 [Phtheirospermum japonicum]|uniref:Heparanase-like protein 1 n=1 Tax=Phtheirospermum japonicum TaxID=374723 RepID=A0A830BS71_9LAMI|nr:heparanase-like protein 1 [Phtheirospermum japonicum]
MKSKGLICCILLSLFCVSLAEKVNLRVNGEFSVAETDKNFICATLDWWPHDKCNYNQCPWGNAGILNLDLENKILANAIKAFRALRIRIGGSLQDKVVYKVGSYPKKCSDFEKKDERLFGFSKGCLNMHRWDSINKLFNETGAQMIFGLNALTRKKKLKSNDTLMVGAWDHQNAFEFMNYTVSKGYNIDSYELGNELCGSGIGVRVEAHQYAKDIKVLKKIVQKLYPDSPPPNVLGPAGFYEKKWFNTFLKIVGPNVIDGLTHHIYNLGAGSDKELIKKVENGTYLDRVAETYGNISSSIKAHGPWAKPWVGESGGAYNSGGKQVSSSFANGFWYLDQLGMTSKFGNQVFCRQSLIGGNYGLLDTATFIPKPDYYGALLWSRLMGKNVLSASHNASKSLRVYSHCSKNTTGISLLIINLSNSTTFEVKVNKYAAANQRQEYHLTPEGDDILSEVVLLNGTPLKLTETSDIPTLDPRFVNATSPIQVMPHSIVFATLEGFNATACA